MDRNPKSKKFVANLIRMATDRVLPSEKKPNTKTSKGLRLGGDEEDWGPVKNPFDGQNENYDNDGTYQIGDDISKEDYREEIDQDL